MNQRDRIIKRLFDVVLASLGLIATGWLIAVAIVAARWSTGKSGMFHQLRVGMDGRLFHILKIRTMRDVPGIETTVTTRHDPRITPLGGILRKYKIDELPQLINVLRGDMSFVGPRPDVPELICSLQGRDRILLSVRPGVTGPASLKYRNEEDLLAVQDDPDAYNREVIFPDKTQLNRQYVEDYRFVDDLRYIWLTAFSRNLPPDLPHDLRSLHHEQAA